MTAVPEFLPILRCGNDAGAEGIEVDRGGKGRFGLSTCRAGQG